MSGETARVHYFDKQFLRVDEFRDEQLYQLALRRRHNNTQHTWGIVAGLEVMREESAIVVQPGLAIDGYGRELLLGSKRTVAAEWFDNLDTDRLDLWLIYDRRDDESAPEGYGDCRDMSADAYRSPEEPLLLYERPVSQTVDPRRPPRVPAEALDARVPPLSDDPRDEWRVYLGRVIRLERGEYSIDETRRPYVGSIAESIDHPATAARVEIGRESAVEHTRSVRGVTYRYNEDAGRRFGVFVADDLGPNTDEGIDLLPRVEIQDSGRILLRGSTSIHGDLQLSGGAVQFVDGSSFADEEAPQVPSMYRYTEGGSDELRIDLGVDSEARKFVIGFSSADGKFTPIVTVQLEKNENDEPRPVVVIAGELKVDSLTGAILPVPISPEAMAALATAFAQGLNAGNGNP